MAVSGNQVGVLACLLLCGSIVGFSCGLDMLFADPNVNNLQLCTISFVRRSYLSPASYIYGFGDYYHVEYYAYAYNCQGSLKDLTASYIDDDVIAKGQYINVTVLYPPPPVLLNPKNSTEANAFIMSMNNQDRVGHVSAIPGFSSSRGNVYGAW